MIHFVPATADQIEDEVVKIISIMPAPRTTDGEQLMRGYVSALNGMSKEAISKAVSGFLGGRFSPEFSSRWCPMPPELAVMARRCADEVKQKTGGRSFSYRMPRSKVIRQRITRETVRQLVDAGAVPRGVIWCPGPHGREGDRPDIGTLFDPDPNWQRPQIIKHLHEITPDDDREEEPLSPEDMEKLAAVRRSIVSKTRAA